MRVQDIHSAMPDMLSKVESDATSPAKDKATVFRRQLTAMDRSQREEHIAKLREQIDIAGARLAKKADVGELQKYRELVKSLVNETVSNGFTFSKSDMLDARGRHRVFAVIKKIDVKLDELTKEVLSEQKDNLSILHKIDDIRGLLVDMLL